MTERSASACQGPPWLAFIVGAAVIGSIIVAPLVAQRFPGSTIAFAACTAVYLATLALCMHRHIPYSVFYLAVFLWLGVWVKLAAHQLLDYEAAFGVAYLEPVGGFSFSGSAWDDVVLTAASGGAGLLVAMTLWLTAKKGPLGSEERAQTPMPSWYPRNRAACWVAASLALLAVVLANERFSLLKLGWRPHFVLPWPLSGLLPWYLFIGAALIVAVLAGWDRAARRSPWTGLTAAGIEGAAVAGSIMSRGVFLFHAGPYVIALMREQSLWSLVKRRQVYLLLCAFVLLLVASAMWANYARYLGSAALPDSREEVRHSLEQPAKPLAVSPRPDNSLSDVVRESSLRLARLLVDRWLGLEGIMVLSAHPEKNWNFFVDAVKERRTLDSVDLYTRISQPRYDQAATARYHYATLPGAIGLLYFSGSRWVVFVGMFGLTLLALAIESSIARMLLNPYATSLVAMYVVIMIVQLSPGLFQRCLSLSTTVAACLMFAALIRFSPPRPGGAA